MVVSWQFLPAIFTDTLSFWNVQRTGFSWNVVEDARAKKIIGSFSLIRFIKKIIFHFLWDIYETNLQNMGSWDGHETDKAAKKEAYLMSHGHWWDSYPKKRLMPNTDTVVRYVVRYEIKNVS